MRILVFMKKISKIPDYVRELIISKIKWSHLLLLFVIVSIIGVAYSSYMIYYDKWGPTSDYDWTYFNKNKAITSDDKRIISASITGIVRSKGIISPKNPAELKIFRIEFDVKKEILKDSLCFRSTICRDNANATVSLEGFNARGYNESESVDYTWEREEFPEIENIILKKGYEDEERILYINQSEISKKLVFITSGPQTLRLCPEFYCSIVIEDAFEVKPYADYSELQLSKYVFLLTLIGFIVVIFQIIDFGLKICDRLRKQQK